MFRKPSTPFLTLAGLDTSVKLGRGRRREFHKRDREAVLMREQKLTLAEIGQKLRAKGLLQFSNPGTDPQTVSEILKREKKREQAERKAIETIEQLKRDLLEIKRLKQTMDPK